jgi:ATP-dependent Clp protease ATP-binding subunit ClpB
MRLDKLTAKFQNALADAQSLAVGRDHQFIEPLHVMAALLDQQGGTAPHLLGAAGVDVKGLRSRVFGASKGRVLRCTSRGTSKSS